MKWLIQLTGIVWDDNKGEYDVSDLPDEFSVVVEAPDRETAIEYALSDASDAFGSLSSHPFGCREARRTN